MTISMGPQIKKNASALWTSPRDRMPTAVEQFAHEHDLGVLPATPYYRDLIPSRSPSAGEQYAFEVDLDACSGCKSCVAACHSLNGLGEGESWRFVGSLTGGSTAAPVAQHVTTSCHHCLEPACMTGCPVNAYEKDSITGIVRHLDDQCIGCQYCTLTCPYDAPKYLPGKGIVRKCDMCSQRLEADEAPACVQACPNHAIGITVVSQRQVIEDSESNQFVPGAAEPERTLPTTVYKTGRVLPRNLVPVDYHDAAPQHSHPSLVAMLVFTQMSVGAFLLEYLSVQMAADASGAVRWQTSVAALFLGMLGLFAALFHLGRPHLAYRAVLGLRRSWLSREILCFSLFAGLAAVYAAACAPLDIVPASAAAVFGGIAASAGLAGVACSVMIYVCTGREVWKAPLTFAKFYLTTILLGASSWFLLSRLNLSESGASASLNESTVWWLVIAATLLKLLCESSIFPHQCSRRNTPTKRTAGLLLGPLAMVTLRRYAFGIAGGIVLPSLLIQRSALPAESTATLILAVLALTFSLLGELFERHLFFAAVVTPTMPRGVRT